MIKELEEYDMLVCMINAHYHDVAVRMNMSDSVQNILYTLILHDYACNQSVFYKETGMAKSTVNSAIHNLEKNNIVYLKPGENKNKIVVLTDKGIRYANDTVGKVIEAETEVLSKWTKEEREMFIYLNKKYENNIEEAFKNLSYEKGEEYWNFNYLII